jgi:hypothetical protein
VRRHHEPIGGFPLKVGDFPGEGGAGHGDVIRG